MTMVLLMAAGMTANARPQPDVPDRTTWSFTDAGDGLPHEGQWRDGFAVADVDGDGVIDIAHGPARKRVMPPAIFKGDGHGHWQRWSARFPSLPYDYGDVAVADVDADGVADLILGVHLRGVFVLRGSRDGEFTDASRGLDVATGIGRTTSVAVAVADWDGDGRPDVLALGEGMAPAGPVPGSPRQGTPGLAVFRNLGGDGWQRLASDPIATGPAGAALAVGDVDGDHRVDVVTASNQLGRRDLRYAPSADGLVRAATIAALPESTIVRGVALGDLDGDGRADLVIAGVTRDDAGWYGRVDVLWNGVDGWRDAPLAVAGGRDGVRAVAVGDADGDGRADVVALTGDGRVLAYAGAGDRRFAHEREPQPPWSDRCAGSHVALADVDGDGRAEIVASFAEEDDGESATRCRSGGGIAVWKVTVGR